MVNGGECVVTKNLSDVSQTLPRRRRLVMPPRGTHRAPAAAYQMLGPEVLEGKRCQAFVDLHLCMAGLFIDIFIVFMKIHVIS